MQLETGRPNLVANVAVLGWIAESEEASTRFATQFTTKTFKTL